MQGDLLSLDTRDTMTDVHVEELWTRTVKRMAIIRPTIGLANRVLLWNIVPRSKTIG
jgi:hypothetical protein